MAHRSTINMNRLLVALLVGLVLLEIGYAVVEATLRNLVWALAMIIPLILALKGRGGKILYWLALSVSWLLAALMLLLVYDVYVFSNGEPPYDDGQAFDYAGGLLVFIVSAFGVACHFCITRTHPVVNKTKLDQELNSLFIGLMQGLVFGFGANVILLVLCVDGDWTFSELMWVYWIESVMISGFSTWTITTLDQFDASNAGLIGKTVEDVKKDLLDNQIRGMGVLYCMYLAVILFLVGIPDISNLRYLPVILVAYVASHYFEARQKQRELQKRRPRLARILKMDVYRILPIHLAIILAIISYGDADPAVAILFVMFKAVIDIVTEIINYRHLRLMAIEYPACTVEFESSYIRAKDGPNPIHR